MSSNHSRLFALASLQMAAEALFGLQTSAPGSTFVGPFDTPQKIGFLTTGNGRASRFTRVQAEEFAQIWEVVEHTSNSLTGFSGTLFKARADAPPQLLARYGATANQLVLSLRSTEFIDDAARDNQSNAMEIRERGWAFGQIADMQRCWVSSLTTSGILDRPAIVTGYSLGAQMATAFNRIYPSLAASTYTFNGVGVGEVNNRWSLASVIELFERRPSQGNQDLFTNEDTASLYGQLKETFNGHRAISSADVGLALDRAD